MAPRGELAYLRARLGAWAAPVPTMLAATDPDAVLRNDLYDRDEARQWSRGRVLVVGDAAHPMRPHLGQGGCQGIEDAAILAKFVDGAGDLGTAFARFATFRRPRVRALVRESALIGRIVNLRPAFLSGLACRATVLVPRHSSRGTWLAGLALGVRASRRTRRRAGMTASLGPLVVDAVDPAAAEAFWAAALGVPTQRALLSFRPQTAPQDGSRIASIWTSTSATSHRCWSSAAACWPSIRLGDPRRPGGQRILRVRRPGI